MDIDKFSLRKDEVLIMKSFLKPREEVILEMKNQLYSQYSEGRIIEAVIKLIADVKKMTDVNHSAVRKALHSVLDKTETFSVLSSLMELEIKAQHDQELQTLMLDPSYNQHRAIAINICDMYSSGATSFFGYVDCTFRDFFPEKHPKSFLAKGVCAIIASVAEVMVTGAIETEYLPLNIALLEKRGVTMKDMTRLVFDLQRPYNPSLQMEDCQEHVEGVLRKQQTYHAIHLCVTIDAGVENNEFGDQFQAIVGNDEGLYGVDESVNTSISKMYGMIAITNFGYLDKAKPGIIGELDSVHDGKCNTFIDDTVCAIVSAACARLAHNNANTTSKPKK